MPELPEVETVRRGLAPVLEGAIIADVHLARADLRLPFPDRFAARLAGRTVVRLGRRSKYLLAELDDGNALLAHLGMSGSFRIEGSEPAGDFHRARSRDAAHDHVRIRLRSGAAVIYNDPRRFGFMDIVPLDGLGDSPRLAGLGPEPLGNGFDAVHLATAFARHPRAPVKAVLLDQSVVAGLGNIYVCEALHRAGLSPLRPAGDLAGAADALARLTDAVRRVLAEAIEAGGSSLRDHMRTDGTLGYFQHRFAVYDREGAVCPRPGCGGTVERIRQSGRSTFHCRRCQS